MGVFTQLSTCIKLTVCTLMLLIGMSVTFSYAEEMPTFPIPRIETGAHTDRPNDIGFDPVRNQLISVSDDRSIRFWDFDTGRQADVLYVPMSTQKDGELYALSIAPKARMLVVGGWTGHSWDKSISMYVFNLDTMEMLGRVSQIPERIVALAFSMDESRLAVTLFDGRLMLFSTPDFRLIKQNHDCKQVSYRLAYSVKGIIAANCFDGFVRLYDSDLKLVKQAEPMPGHQLSSVSFSPSGDSILVTYYDRTGVLILDTKTLKTKKTLEANIGDDIPLPQGAWSSDGESVYAGGDYEQEGKISVLKWDVSGASAPVAFPLSDKRLFRLVPLNDGGIAYTSLDQSIGRISSSGEIKFNNKPPSVVHEGNSASLLVSADGKKVEFVSNSKTKASIGYSVIDRDLYVPLDSDATLLSPRTKSAKIHIENWQDSESPTLNGKPIKLAARQTSRAIAISHDDQFFVLGVDSQIRKYASDGKLLWSIFSNAGPYSINITKDGKSIVAGLQDGSIRWYSVDTGKEFYALYAHHDGKEWVAWTPPGFYVSSANGDQYIGWHINQTTGSKAKFYSAWQFERILYRPDLVEDYFLSQGEWSQSGLPRDYRDKTMRDNAPPDLSVRVEVAKNKGDAKIVIEAEKIGLPISHYSVFVNDLPVVPHSARTVGGLDNEKLTRSHKISLSDEESVIRVEVYTENSFAVRETFLRVAKPKTAPKGDLYLIAVGVNHFEKVPKEQGIDLQYAAQDSEVISSLLEMQEKQYNNVYTTVLNDFTEIKPYKTNILTALDSLKNTGPADTVIVYLASHGISNEAGDYFMVPRDALFEDIENVMGYNSLVAESLIKWTDIIDALRNASGKRYLIVDTCQAEKIEGNYDFGSLAKRSSAMSFGLLAASKGDELAQEYPPGEQGLFSYSLAKAIVGEGDLDGDDVIDISELYKFTSEFIETERLDKSAPQTPQLVAPAVLEESPFVLL